MAACRQVGASHHTGDSLDIPGSNEVDERLPAAAQELFQGYLADTCDGVGIAVFRKEV